MRNGKLDAQIARLNLQINAEHARFIQAAKVAVVAVLGEYGLTLDDLTATKLTKQLAKATEKPAKKVTATKAKKTAKKATRKPPFKGPQPPKYRDPTSGTTWSGFGHAPSWIAGAKDRTKFLINGAADV